MQLGIIEVPTLKDLFVEKIEDQILSGKLRAGDALPSERQLHEETHISKTVIHAGLVELERKGFIEVIPRKGTFVANYDETGTMETLNSLIRHNGGNMTPSQAKHFLEARIAIEGAALRRLAEDPSEEDISVLEQKLADIDAAASDPAGTDRLSEAFFCFHRCICLRSGNEFFPLLLNEFKPVILAFWERSIMFFGVAANVSLSRRYLEDIRRRDGESAYARLVKSVNEYLSCCYEQ